MHQPPSFAEILRQFRISRQYTQEELAERALLGLDTISALERATRVKPRKVTVTQLAGALDLSESEQVVFFDAARGNSLNAASALAVAPPSPVPWPAGATEIAQELLASCIVQLRASENVHVLLDALRVGVHVALNTHADLASVRLDLDEALALTQAVSFPAYEVRVRYTYGLLATRLQEYPVAYQHFQEALVICERIGEGCYRPYVEQALAQLPHKQ